MLLGEADSASSPAQTGGLRVADSRQPWASLLDTGKFRFRNCEIGFRKKLGSSGFPI
jgi:hypothetical protein